MTLLPVPFELKDGFKRRFLHASWVPQCRMWRISCWELREAQKWIAREQAKLAKKKPAR